MGQSIHSNATNESKNELRKSIKQNNMALKTPIVRRVSWISVIPQFLFMGILIFIYYTLELKEPILYGALTYLIISISLRNLIAKSHRQGMRFVKQQQFSNAIPFFEKSIDFFTNNKWVDKYRFITLLSSSRMSYKEMGLCNVAFCYSQIGNGLKAKEYYERTLGEFPSNGIAITALKLINSVENKE
jgi:tetratricopeptide (TPR) repeat protein